MDPARGGTGAAGGGLRIRRVEHRRIGLSRLRRGTLEGAASLSGPGGDQATAGLPHVCTGGGHLDLADPRAGRPLGVRYRPGVARHRAHLDWKRRGGMGRRMAVVAGRARRGAVVWIGADDGPAHRPGAAVLRAREQGGATSERTWCPPADPLCHSWTRPRSLYWTCVALPAPGRNCRGGTGAGTALGGSARARAVAAANGRTRAGDGASLGRRSRSLGCPRATRPIRRVDNMAQPGLRGAEFRAPARRVGDGGVLSRRSAALGAGGERELPAARGRRVAWAVAAALANLVARLSGGPLLRALLSPVRAATRRPRSARCR